MRDTPVTKWDGLPGARPFDLSWLIGSSHICGFVGHPSECDVRTVRVDPPYRRNVELLAAQHGKIAPYSGVIHSVRLPDLPIGEDSVVEYMVLRFCACKP